MIRTAPLVAVFALTALTQTVAAQSLSVPGLTPDSNTPALPSCDLHPYHDQRNCVRALACIGDEGLWMDGQARGWDEGSITGYTSQGVSCVGFWNSRGAFGTGFAKVECADGLTLDVIYTVQDNETGTVIGTGRDSLDRPVKAWSGLHVLEFLKAGKEKPELPCGPVSIPIS